MQSGKYFACDKIQNEGSKIYFFIDENKKIFIRSGYFFGTEAEFIDRLKEIYQGTKFEKHYILALELAKAVLLDD